MLDSDEQYTFESQVELDAYGKAIFKVTTTKDHLVNTDLKIFDLKTRALLQAYTES